MSRILVVGIQNRDNEELCSGLSKQGLYCFFVPDDDKLSEYLARNPPDLVVINTGRDGRLIELARQIKQTRNSPVIALLEAGMLESALPSAQISSREHVSLFGKERKKEISPSNVSAGAKPVAISAKPSIHNSLPSQNSTSPDSFQESRSADRHMASRMNGVNQDNLVGIYFDPALIDDFVVNPPRFGELEFRIKRLLAGQGREEGEQIKLGDMVIDLAKCEVSVAGRPVLLTFKEYQLLKFLAGNPGRVFSRDALLNKVWGYEYFGGDRTVDVHVKRLRSKIEDINHSFIETVRNIGYRLKLD